jgi:hypothetical protein
VQDRVAPVLELELVTIIVRMVGMGSDYKFWKEIHVRYWRMAD